MGVVLGGGGDGSVSICACLLPFPLVLSSVTCFSVFLMWSASVNALCSLLPCVWSVFHLLWGSWRGTFCTESGTFPKLGAVSLCSDYP